MNTGNAFLWVDEEAERLQRVRAGEIIVSPVGPRYPKRVPDGMIHDWAGAAFIHDATLRDVLQVVRSYGPYKDLYQPTVIDSRVKDASATKDRFSMLLIHKSTFLKTALDADYESRYISRKRSTFIQRLPGDSHPGRR